jgi:hypothetical protein
MCPSATGEEDQANHQAEQQKRDISELNEGGKCHDFFSVK